MIKHRFILRGKDDFRVFAAIPTEHTVLTWEQWTRPPDWAALLEIGNAALNNAERVIATFNEFGDEARFVALYVVESFGAALADIAREIVADTQQEVEWANTAVGRVEDSVTLIRDVLSFIHGRDPNQPPLDFRALVESLKQHLSHKHDPHGSLASRAEQTDRNIAVYTRNIYPRLLAESPHARHMLQYLRTQRAHVERLQQEFAARIALAAPLDALISSDPAVLPPCPLGVPFAAYTIEFDDTIVNVVEGQAWIDGRDATATERIVVEIITQMLTERALNSTAETRIPIVESDPAHAARTRAAEDRDRAKPPAEHKLRTIKFSVSPPRYLRAAAEHILSSPRRAHWVIGHWREQAHGEGHKLRRRTWIHPHIRGLGDAGAVVARVAASDA